ncbi:hypothetical protein [Calothrix sp. FACHB-1219]|nr:hypothetical protein [Calothrix sp. FACHB-1219]MBD2201664.1 hypothetical protein [Calothrix sp. FACHB-168]
MKNVFYFFALVTCVFLLYKNTEKQRQKKTNHLYLIKVETEIEDREEDEVYELGKEEAKRVHTSFRGEPNKEVDETIDRIKLFPIYKGDVDQVRDITDFLNGKAKGSGFVWIDTDYMTDVYPPEEENDLED